MIVLGIDPGTRVSGFVIFKKEGRQLMLLDYGLLTMPGTQPLPERVSEFFSFFKAKIEAYCVSDISLETPFLGKNAANFLKLGYLRGALYILSCHYSISLHEYSPREVKLSVTGFGGADKEQVSRMILRLFPGLSVPARYDLTDAFAVALCFIWSAKSSRSNASDN